MAATGGNLQDTQRRATALLERFTARRLGHFINGEQVAGLAGKSFTNFAPMDNSAIGEVAAGDARDVDAAATAARAAFPVVAATGSQSLKESEQLTAHAVKAGADALLIVTPYYLRPPQRGLVEYYLTLARSHDTPWMVYHIPGRTAVGVTLDTLKRLNEQSPTFVGMKHAVNDLGFVSECLGAFGADFRIFVGLEELSYPMMAVGASGLMNAVGNLRTDVLAEMCNAVWQSDLRQPQLFRRKRPRPSRKFPMRTATLSLLSASIYLSDGWLVISPNALL